MVKMPSRVIRKPLASWIGSQNKWLQFLLVITALFAVFANVLPLEMQKRIVNDAINLRNFDLKHGEHMALVGYSGSGKSTLAQCIVQLVKYSGGEILFDQNDVSNLSKTDITQNIGFVSQTPFIFEGSIEENLLYAVSSGAQQAPSVSQPEMPSLDDRILALQQSGLFTDVLRFGLNAVLDKNKHQDIIGTGEN